MATRFGINPLIKKVPVRGGFQKTKRKIHSFERQQIESNRRQRNILQKSSSIYTTDPQSPNFNENMRLRKMYDSEVERPYQFERRINNLKRQAWKKGAK